MLISGLFESFADSNLIRLHTAQTIKTYLRISLRIHLPLQYIPNQTKGKRRGMNFPQFPRLMMTRPSTAAAKITSQG